MAEFLDAEIGKGTDALARATRLGFDVPAVQHVRRTARSETCVGVQSGVCALTVLCLCDQGVEGISDA